MKTLSDFMAQARALNTIFSVVFVKKTTGEVREMQCRTGVRKGVTGALPAGQRRAEDDRCGVLTVFDVAKMRENRAEGMDDDTAAKRAFRRINVAGLQTVAMSGKRYTVDPETERLTEVA
jgi:hypothetical protein